MLRKDLKKALFKLVNICIKNQYKFFEKFRIVFIWFFNILIGISEMGNGSKFVYTTPKQIPLFEEEDDGVLKLYDCNR
ncbi:MAG: hypothetical protein JSV67_06215 [Thermoplasmatales archaeon]|nr:MAG: hypothetical protein JSV67_06215 [Thermoplasmatales archaeon]